MCLAVIGKVIEVKPPEKTQAFPTGIVEILGIRRPVNFGLLDSVRAGEYVLIHAGFAIQKMTSEEARQVLSLMQK
ncbi:MAG: HypC/HybG/HupF family hydrogenase formation chaperone [Candidatus Omnitrophota bacterium]